MSAGADHFEQVHKSGGGNLFQNADGNWFCATFGNNNAAPWHEMPGAVKIEFDATRNVMIAKNQPKWFLQYTAPGKWPVIGPHGKTIQP